MATILRSLILTDLERDLGMTGRDFAHVLGCDARAWERWKSGESIPQKANRDRLDALLQFHSDLMEAFTTPDAARAWLHSESPYLGGLSPADAIRAGRLDRAVAALDALDSGVFI